jgi:hypothetical protein
MITFTPSAERCLRESKLLMRSSEYDIYLMECSSTGVGDPPIIFAGPWLTICGYERGTGPQAKRYTIFECSLFITDQLFDRLRSRVIDEKTLWDPVSGISHTGLYLK